MQSGMTSYVVYDEEFGIFLGHFMGLGIWSKADPAGQTYACTFTQQEGQAFIKEFGKPEYRLVPVETGPDGYASMAQCVAAGLPGWIVEDADCEHAWEEIEDQGDWVKIKCTKCKEMKWVEVPQ